MNKYKWIIIIIIGYIKYIEKCYIIANSVAIKIYCSLLCAMGYLLC